MQKNSIKPPENCTSCGLCAHACPHGAIRMEWNAEGFLEPVVEAKLCMACGACVRSCPATANKDFKPALSKEARATMRCYGAWNTRAEHRLASSSGGIFSALAEKVFAEGGCVFGVRWKDKETAEFAKAESRKEWEAMRGSKYVQAVPGSVYSCVKMELERGRRVLFAGTPCQVHALNKYLRKEYPLLLTLDIVCHGVPSRKLLQSYIQYWETKLGKSIKEINFRSKEESWQHYKVRKTCSDGFIIEHAAGQDMFMALFLEDCMLNRACYKCPYATFPRQGDLTLGDFWGNLARTHADWPIAEGISALIASTPRGKAILEELHAAGDIAMHSVPVQELLDGQFTSYLRLPNPPHSLRTAALAMLDTAPLDRVFDAFYSHVVWGPFCLSRQGIAGRVALLYKRIKKRFLRVLFFGK